MGNPWKSFRCIPCRKMGLSGLCLCQGPPCYPNRPFQPFKVGSQIRSIHSMIQTPCRVFHISLAVGLSAWCKWRWGAFTLVPSSPTLGNTENVGVHQAVKHRVYHCLYKCVAEHVGNSRNDCSCLEVCVEATKPFQTGSHMRSYRSATKFSAFRSRGNVTF